MSQYYIYFLDGIEKTAKENGGIVKMNQWFSNLAFDVHKPGVNESC
jgi:hypothetical protein